MNVKNDMEAEAAEDAATERRLAAIMAQDPDLRVKRLSIHRSGHDSVALDINDALICKFPRNALATRRLRRELAGIYDFADSGIGALHRDFAIPA